MAERDDAAPLIILIAVVVITFAIIAIAETYKSQVRDLQRRVGQLEQRP